MTHYKNRFQSFDSLYLGGGTPTLLRVEILEDLLDYVFMYFDFTPDIEFTIEANPRDLTLEKARELKALGFNRVNVGIQSFDERELVFLGRTHTGEDAMRALRNLRVCGFNNVGIDLIYGIEGQSLKGWISTLRHALAVRPEHISCYQLAIEKRTPFWRMKQKRMMKPFSEEKERTFFMETSKILEDNGYLHYEVSNFARKTVYYSRHNAKYWHHVPYLGLGPSAHSFQESTRWWNFRSIRQYCTALGTRKVPVEGYENLTDEQIKLECIALGLRTRDGFEARQINNNPFSIEALSKLQHLGFLQVKGDRIVPTKEGLLVADHLPLCFSE
jgi:oxygen-independent coproporphyrinogen-3 oxidase